jgi:hypothetical protein
MRKLLLEKSKKLATILEDVEELYEEAKVKHSTIDKLRNDILHEITLDSLSAVDMTKKYIELRTTLRLRTIYKDNIDYLKTFRRYNSLKNAKKSANEINEISKNKKYRKYTKRVESEVRQEILDDINKYEGV